MFSAADKTVKPPISVQRKKAQTFFGPQKESGEPAPTSSFFKPNIQPKLTVNKPDDHYEKEADLIADRVVNTPEPKVVVAPMAPPEVQRQEEVEEEQETVQTSAITIQRMADDEQEENPTIQTKQSIGGIQRTTDGLEVASNEEDETVQTYSHQRSPGMYHSDVLQLSGRGPPAGAVQFKSQLHNSASGGRAMAQPVGNFMSSRFGADFSTVRIHTDTSAQQMSKQVNAYAFTYGNHIYFNSGKYDPVSKSGQTLLAHELTHTIQQGAVPVHAQVQRKHNFTAVQRKSILQRQAAPQLTQAVEIAEAEQGKVIANKKGADGHRYGWERLTEYFETSFGKDKIVSQPSTEKNTVPRKSIKTKSEFKGNIILDDGKVSTGKRDAMPSWCGIFAFWALHKAGIPMPMWQLGKAFLPPESAYPKGHIPQPGDIAYKELRSHFGLVVGMEGTNRVKSINGNTAGDDNLGGEIQVQTHDLSNWQGFFNPLVAKTGNLRDAENRDKDTEPKSFKELRKLKYNVNRKADNETEDEELQAKSEQSDKEEQIQSKSEENQKEGGIQAKTEGTEKEHEEDNIQRSEIGSPGGFASMGMELEPDSSTADIQTKAEDAPAQQVRNKSPGAIIQGGWLGSAWNAVSGLASDVADLIEEGLDAAKDWLLDKVRDFVVEIPGYTLLSYILGYDPITGKVVDNTPLTLLDSVLDTMHIGGNMVKWVLEYFDAINPVADWLFTSVKRFSRFISDVEDRFENFWNGLSISDAGNPEKVMSDVANLFQSIVTDIVHFVDEVGGDFLTMVKDIALSTLVTFVKDYFPDAYDLMVLFLGKDPITGESVDFNGTNILNAALKVLGERGAQIKGQMLENGIFDKCVGWIDRSIGLAQEIVSDVGNIFTTIWDLITFDSLFSPVETFTRIAEAFLTPINKIISFFTDAMIVLVGILRKALLSGLSKYAKNTRGYFLITVLINKDPFTGKKVPRSTENIIHGFFSLMSGGEAQFQQMKESGAIDRMTEKISKAIRKLNFSWEYIVGLFTGLWESLDWTDFLIPGAVFVKIIKTFADPIRRLVNFITVIIKIAIEILMVVMNFPIDTVNNIIARSMEAFGNIKRDPIGFLKNILRGIKQGFVQFFDNILKHLLSGLGNWLFGSLGELGIQMPPDLSFKSILNLIMQILGISVEKIMERVWIKLTEKIGAEKVAKIKNSIDKLTGIWSFVKDVIDRGPIAIWEYVQEKLSDLWNMVLDAAKGWIMTKIIGEVTAKLLTMLDPTGIMAVINSVIAIYRAIQSFIEQLRAMLEILNSFVNGIAEIAAGNVQAAADYLEGAMARSIPVLIGFLANQVGLGGIGKKIAEVIGKIRVKIIAGIDWLVEKALKIGMPIIDGVLRVIEFGEGIVAKGKAKVKGAIDSVLKWWKKKKSFRGADGKSHKLYFRGSKENSVLTVASDPITLTSLLEKKKKSDDITLNQTITDAINLSTQIDAIRAELEGVKDDEEKGNLDAKIDSKMVELVPLLITLMGNGKSVKILEIYLNKKVTDDQGVISENFNKALDSNENMVDGKKVYGLSTRQKNNKTETTVVRQSGMAVANYMSIAIVDKILIPSPEKAYVPPHTEYKIADIDFKDFEGDTRDAFQVNVTTKNGNNFTATLSENELETTTQTRVENQQIVGSGLARQSDTGVSGRSRMNSTTATGLHRAHLIANRFQGPGEAQSLNIILTSPSFNTGDMAGVEKNINNWIGNKTESERSQGTLPADGIYRFKMRVTAILEFNEGRSLARAILNNLIAAQFVESDVDQTTLMNQIFERLMAEANTQKTGDGFRRQTRRVKYFINDTKVGAVGPDKDI